MRSLLSLLVLSALWLLAPRALAAPQELIVNGTFETGNLTGWTQARAIFNGCDSDFRVNNTGDTGCVPFPPAVFGNSTFAAYSGFAGSGPLHHEIHQAFNVPAVARATLSFRDILAYNYLPLTGSARTVTYTLKTALVSSEAYKFTTPLGFGGQDWTGHSVDVTTFLQAHPGEVVTLSIDLNVPGRQTLQGYGVDDVSILVTPAVALAPTNPSTPPNGSVTFTASGGSGGPYTYAIKTNSSGCAIDAITGVYKAGNAPNVVDTVEATETATGYTGKTDVRVGPALAVTPSAVTLAPRAAQTFTATGGGTGISWAITSNNSGGVIDPNTGAYAAGTIGTVTDIVTATDSVNNTAISTVTVGPIVSIKPATPLAHLRGPIAFTAEGGSLVGYAWAFVTNGSGGTIDPGTGAYLAGATPKSVDVVQVTDSLGNVAMVNVAVGDAIAINPALPKPAPRGAIAFIATGGEGAEFAWSFQTNASGGTIVPTTGEYTAGSTPDVIDVITVTDPLGNTAQVEVLVGAGVSITPANPIGHLRGPIAFSAGGGSGVGYAWTLVTNGSSGTLDTGTGAYVAGATPSSTDVIKVTDSLGNTASVTVNVGPAVAITPALPKPPPRGTIPFVATGGSEAGFLWSFETNASGGALVPETGAYTAGSKPSVTDVIKVTDSLGNTAQVDVLVGAGVTIAPATPTAALRGPVAFTASGGSGPPYTWAFVTNASGGTIAPDTGAYAAGATPDTVDVVKVTDSLGNTAEVNVAVGGAVAINPAAPNPPPRGAIPFVATGGAGAGFGWSIVTNASGGNIVPATGVYTAGTTPNVTDVVAVTDPLGNTAQVDVLVGPGVSITPAIPFAHLRGPIAFSATGGSGAPYVWALTTSGSGGTINGATGAYVAGGAPNTIDVVKATDALGNTASVNVTVGRDVAITPALPRPPPREKIAFVATGGSGAGFVWSIVTNASGGAIVPATGIYTAGSKPDVTDAVKVTDSLGNMAQVNVLVGAGVSITPATTMAKPGARVTFTAIGGSGIGFAWTLETNASGGSIDGATGTYTAGPNAAVDTVAVLDSLGNAAHATVTVTMDAPATGGDGGVTGNDAGAGPIGAGDTGGGGGGSCSAGGPPAHGATGLFGVALAAAAALRRRRRRRTADAPTR